METKNIKQRVCPQGHVQKEPGILHFDSKTKFCFCKVCGQVFDTVKPEKKKKA